MTARKVAREERMVVVEKAAGKRAPEARGFEAMPRREKARWGKGSREPGVGLLLDWVEVVEA